MVILTIPMGAYTFYQENHNLNGNGKFMYSSKLMVLDMLQVVVNLAG